MSDVSSEAPTSDVLFNVILQEYLQGGSYTRREQFRKAMVDLRALTKSGAKGPNPVQLTNGDTASWDGRFLRIKASGARRIAR